MVVSKGLNFLLLFSLGYKFAFYDYSTARIDSRGVPYDYESIMHYGNSAFSKNGQRTIVAKDKRVKKLGNRHLSPLDIKQANMMYNCPGNNRWSKHV